MIFWSNVAAWAATVLCAFVSARAATVFAKNSPRIFTILALFSLNWALLVPYYSESAPSELMAGFAGFLLVYVGVLLRRAAYNPLTTEQERAPSAANGDTNNAGGDLASAKAGGGVARKDRIALWLLGLLIAPSLISLPFPQGTIKFLNRSYTEPVLGSLITVIGYLSVWSALKIYSSKRKGLMLMAGILALYTATEIIFTVDLIRNPANPCRPCPTNFWTTPANMKPLYLYLFAILKVSFSTLFIYLVLKDEVLSEEDRNLSLSDKVFKIVGAL